MSFYHPYPPQQYWPTTPGTPPPIQQQQPMFMQHAFQPQPYLYSPPMPSPAMGYYFQPMHHQQTPPQPQPLIQQQQQQPHRMPSRCHSAEVLVSKNRISRPLVPPGHHYPQVKAANAATSHPSMATIAEEHRRSLADDNVPLAILASRNKSQESVSGKQRRSISYSNLRTNRSSSPNRLVRMDPSCSNSSSNMINPRNAPPITPPGNHSGPPSLSSSRFSSTTSSSNSDATSSVGETASITSSSCPPKHANKPSIAKRLMNRLSRSTSTTNIQQHH
ncbi:hypothetical protein O0I10_008906 [Lichtheimia ornata]|uniref:Uncharacterized protein n=1 Tax=Lichtheimia ornata TaxID=688661 RepID=A0AAD7XSL1_9FUNG|nr:uncharacterized protein O0I10_008906 [Lichtheimia ornata]KAJ8655414.1 hypothetical protein O0I10_008906 [Lichtheimia ornata]